MATRSVTGTAHQHAQSTWFGALARAGMVARGAIYLIIGILAIQVAADGGGDTTDQTGALAIVADQPFGRALLVVLAVGLLGYALWRLVSGLLDTDGAGDDASGWFDRGGKIASGLVHAGLFVAALMILSGSGSSSGTGTAQDTTAGVLGWPGGQVWVIVAALAVLGVGLYNVWRGVSRDFMEDLRPSGRARRAVEALGVTGLTARGVAFGLIAVFLAKAAIEYDPQEAVGLDGALARLARESYGPLLLGLVAAGLIAFAVYCVAEARYRDV